ncbi:MAG: YicC family protein [Candidatus Eisenbacteria bacterium]|uniref:YicC family protein n=1 Tax=Eiseniibacteriota bacterium TaxID=2212470 RepID=A0A956SFM9_UNCEI|nr:YicC family protein [Candidatus Eisenbacteria bacterium]MCB9463660.1 YicC family protein [Candidatus Eisenbacteria bacterium]
MLRSMTGYGRGESALGTGKLLVEIRTVNHRFCEISVRLPRSLALLEGKTREVVQSRISRGKINVNVTLDGNDSPVTRLKLNEPISAAYFDVLDQLQKRFHLSGQIDINTFLTLPDVLTWEQEEIGEEESWARLLEGLEAAILDVQDMKEREGNNLAKDLLTRLDLIDERVDRVVARVPEMLANYKKRVEDRLAEISQDADFNLARLESELILFTDRTDCTEECVRLRSHVEQFRGLIHAPEPAGRKLNFLLQEMNREANTIGSKAQDVPIARDVIEIKEEIERLREQVQNFE